jgi:MFS family permease
MISFIVFYVQRDWQEIRRSEISFNISALWATLGFFGINFILLLIAWHILIRSYTGLHDFKQNALNYSYSYLFRFLPTPAWFLSSRMYLYSQSGIRKRVALTITGFETLLHAASGMLVFCLFSVDFSKPVTWLFSLIIIPFFLAIYSPEKLNLRWFSGDESLALLNRTTLVALLIIYTFTWLVSGPFMYSLMQIVSNDIPINMVEIVRIWTISSVVAYIGAYTLGGIGILREFTLSFLLGRYLSYTLALTITIISRLVLILGGILFSILAIGLIKLLSLRRVGQE